MWKMVIIFGFFFLHNFSDGSVFPNSKSKVPVRGKNIGSRNATIYLGYANNPFGPSVRFQHTADASKLKKKSSRMMNSAENIIEKSNSGASQELRAKRGVLQLYNMVSCATDCNPLIYKGYGCYCGFLGSGIAVDGIDRCCKKHDWCYDQTNCPAFLEYFVPYYWTCFHGRPLCGLDHGEWGGSNSCAEKLCECDRILSECLRNYPCPASRAICRSSSWRWLQNRLMIF